ncbi:glycosyltransferase family 2 protein [Solibacillus isronensis]|uniref:glycosyltransferase family 2 protein n=1 Tax=Solibacillus isronensis TaxID=412383 RepID=UPI0009A8F183|nr:glycosyltransferase family 2 protein [Solibacillus isronensis]
MDKISIIVPVYKVEKYIDRCINSLINQTYSNIEIILVDDGSPDKSGEICDTYAKKYSNIKVIHKENGGQSSARNIGLRAATGDYVGFVDSDDWILPDMYESLYGNLKNTSCDISMCQRINVRNKDEANKALNKNEFMVYKGDQIMDLYLTTDMLSVWNKLYKRTLFNDIWFPEGKIHEEIFLMYSILKKTTRMVVSDSQKYCYFLGEISTTRSPLNMKDFNMISEWEKVIEDVKDYYPALIENAKIRLYISYFNLINKYVMFGSDNINTDTMIKKTMKIWIKTLKRNHWLLRKSKYIGNKRMAQINVLCFSYKTFNISKKFFLYINKRRLN